MQNESILMPQWHVVSQSAEQVQLLLHVPSALVHFEGHFPGLPILPGVVQIHWAVALAQAFFPITDATFTGMEQVKFQSIVIPESTIDLHLQWQADRHKLAFSYQRNGAAISGGKLVWKAAA